MIFLEPGDWLRRLFTILKRCLALYILACEDFKMLRFKHRRRLVTQNKF